MTNAQSALAALALALRERLLGGGAAVLPGLGTLARVHVPARVETRPDGSRVLRPPGEAVRLTGAGGDPQPLAALLVRHLGTPQADPTLTLRQALDHLEARLSATGTAPLPGLGTFERTSGGVRFLPGPDLMQSVNQPFAGLPPIQAVPAGAAPPITSPAPPPPAASPAAPSAPPAAPEPPAEATTTVHGVPVLTVGEAPPPAGAPPDEAPAGDRPAADPSAGASHGEEPSVNETLAEDLPADGPPVWETPAWEALDPLPPSPLGAPPPAAIEDADFRVVLPGEDDPDTPLPDSATVASAEVPVPDGSMDPAAASAGAPLPAEASASSLDAPPADAPRGGVLRLVGWFFVLSAISLFAVLWWHSQRPTAAPADPPVAAPATPTAPAPMPLVADTSAAAPADTVAAPMVFEAPGGVAAPDADLDALDASALRGGSVEAGAGGVTWVLHTVRSAAEAEALAARYRASGYRAGTLGAARDGRPAWRVVVGHFQSHEQALRLRDRLPPEAPSDTWPLRLR